MAIYSYPKAAEGGGRRALRRGRGIERKFLVFLSLAILACACGDDGDVPAYHGAPSPRIGSIVVAVECLINGGVIPRAEIQGEDWIKDGKIDPVPEFSQWYAYRQRGVYGGKELDDWTDEVIEAGPDWRCPFS